MVSFRILVALVNLVLVMNPAVGKRDVGEASVPDEQAPSAPTRTAQAAAFPEASEHRRSHEGQKPINVSMQDIYPHRISMAGSLMSASEDKSSIASGEEVETANDGAQPQKCTDLTGSWASTIECFEKAFTNSFSHNSVAEQDRLWQLSDYVPPPSSLLNAKQWNELKKILNAKQWNELKAQKGQVVVMANGEPNAASPSGWYIFIKVPFLEREWAVYRVSQVDISKEEDPDDWNFDAYVFTLQLSPIDEYAQYTPNFGKRSPPNWNKYGQFLKKAFGLKKLPLNKETPKTTEEWKGFGPGLWTFEKPFLYNIQYKAQVVVLRKEVAPGTVSPQGVQFTITVEEAKGSKGQRVGHSVQLNFRQVNSE